MVLVGDDLVIVVLGREAGLGVDAVGFVDLLPGVSICSVGYFLHVRLGGFSTLQEPSPVLLIYLVYGLLGFLEVVVVGPFLLVVGLASTSSIVRLVLVMPFLSLVLVTLC